MEIQHQPDLEIMAGALAQIRAPRGPLLGCRGCGDRARDREDRRTPMTDNDILKAEHARRAAGERRAQEILRLATDGVAESNREARIAQMRKIIDPAMQEANDLAAEALIELGVDEDGARAVAAIVLHATVPTIAQAAIEAQGTP